jgi:integrase
MEGLQAERQVKVDSYSVTTPPMAAPKWFSSPRAPLSPLTLYTMLALAYCAGLRLGEIVRLKLRGVDLADGSIEICDTKFCKSRRCHCRRRPSPT